MLAATHQLEIVGNVISGHGRTGMAETDMACCISQQGRGAAA